MDLFDNKILPGKPWRWKQQIAPERTIIHNLSYYNREDLKFLTNFIMFFNSASST
jgi:hypothetical protein